MLENLAFKVEEAADGPAALAACAQRMPDVILLDAAMPVLDGLGVLAHIRALPGPARPAVIFLTVENDRAEMDNAMRAGADAVLRKPFDTPLLEEAIRAAGCL
jgi:two-component system, chemotaxis family, chemotaxis protein CheY